MNEFQTIVRAIVEDGATPSVIVDTNRDVWLRVENDKYQPDNGEAPYMVSPLSIERITEILTYTAKLYQHSRKNDDVIKDIVDTLQGYVS